MGINGLLLLFFLAPGQSAESARRGTSSWVSRSFHSVQSTLFPSKKSPRKRTWAEVGAVDGLDSMGSGNLPGESWFPNIEINYCSSTGSSVWSP